jgi:hypothetical protein
MRPDDIIPGSLWALLATILRITYNEETDETTAYALINIGHLKDILDAAQSPAFVLSLLSNVGGSVVPWLSDDKRLLSDEEYNIAIAPAYLAILGALERASDDKAEILENYGELLAAISTRITPGAPTFAAFVKFWQRVFGDYFDAEQAPSSLRALLLISGCKLGSESPESQEQESVPETPVDTADEEERQEVSNVLKAVSDSDDSARDVPQSPVVLQSPVVNQCQSLPVFVETQTIGASGAGLSISSDEGEEEVPVELAGPALIEKLLRLRRSFSSQMRRSQSLVSDITLSVPEHDSGPAASDIAEPPTKETQLEISTDNRERKAPPAEDQVLEVPSPSSTREHVSRPCMPSPVATLAMPNPGLSSSDDANRQPSPAGSPPIRSSPVASGLPLTATPSKKRDREKEEDQETPSKRRKLIGVFTLDDSTGVGETNAEVESLSTSLKSVPESVVSPTVSPKAVSEEIPTEAEVPNGRTERQAVSVSSKRSLLPNLCMKLILLLATPLKRKREEEEVSSSRPLETRSPRPSHRALEQPSPSKRRRLETWSDSPALRVLLPSSDELSSSGMCFYRLLTMRVAHQLTQMTLNLKTFLDQTIQRVLRAASPLMLSIRRVSALMSQALVGGRPSACFADLTRPI